MNRHGTLTRFLADGSTVEVQRWRCLRCQKTQRENQVGVMPGRRLHQRHIDRIRAMRLSGLSCEQTAKALQAEGIYVSQATAWRVLPGSEHTIWKNREKPQPLRTGQGLTP